MGSEMCIRDRMWAPTGRQTAVSSSAECSRLWIGLGCRHRRKWVLFPSYLAWTNRIRRCRRERFRPWKGEPLPHQTGQCPGWTCPHRRRPRRHGLQPCWTHVDRQNTRLNKLWEISLSRTNPKLIKLWKITTGLNKLREFLLHNSPSHRVTNGRLTKLLELREFTLSRGLSHRTDSSMWDRRRNADPFPCTSTIRATSARECHDEDHRGTWPD